MLTSNFIHLLDDPWAPHPVVNKHICNGGGGGDDKPVGEIPNAPSAPDYAPYIKRMTEIGETGQGWAKDLMDFAKNTGVDLMSMAKTVGDKAGAAADAQQSNADALQKQWSDLSSPLYKAQQQEALRGISDLPAYRNQVAGQYGADAAQSIDDQKAAIQRKMLATGTTGGQPGIASQALDTQAAIGRSAAVTAAAQKGRQDADTAAWARAGEALKSEEFIPGVASDQAKLASANRAQEADVGDKAATTAAGLYQPATSMYSASIAPMKEWGSTMATDYEDRLKGYGLDINKYDVQNKVASQSKQDEGGGILDTIVPLAAGVAGSYFGGPMGGMAASSVAKGAMGASSGKSGGGGLFGATGGKIPPRGRRIPKYAGGGAIDTSAPTNGGNFIPPEASPSGGDEVDDVPAMVSAGEFVIPERTVDWFGEQYFQKLIAKSDKEREQQTVAAPEEGPPPDDMQQMAAQGGAIQMHAPMFRSEGARV